MIQNTSNTSQPEKMGRRKLRPAPNWTKKPRFAKRILEVGAGQLPYEGVTHIVDKYPASNEQRGEDLWIPEGVEFREGTLEDLPYSKSHSTPLLAEEKFDYFYARHVFEHVLDPVAAIREINRVADQGYIETPSPFYEMICCSFPYDPTEMHTQFVWARKPNEIYVVRKSSQAIQDFCSCPHGVLARQLTQAKRQDRDCLQDSWLPNLAKTTRLFFKGPLKLTVFQDFETPCKQGVCAFQCLESVRFWTSWPLSLLRKKSAPLKALLDRVRE
jgi:hypothetical protein